MKAFLIAGMTLVSASGMAGAEPPELKARDAQVVIHPPLLLAQRRSTPDTSTPGSTAPGNPVTSRPAYVSQQVQEYAAELRKCETIGEAAQRLACKNSVRNRFGEM